MFFVMCVLSTALALMNIDSVFSLVVFAWSGLASAFGPLCVMLIYRSHKVSKVSAIAGMIVGLSVSTAWYMMGLSVYCMELVPGMIVSWLTIEMIGNREFAR
jgi:sodium/proline symporter